MYSPKEFCETYNPDLQSRLMMCGSIAELSRVTDCPTIGDVALAYGVDGVKEWLKCHLLKVNGFVGAKQKLSDEQLNDLSEQITCEYPFLNIAEICCFFGRLRSGRYEDFYGSVDPLRIMKSLDAFCRNRREDICRMEDEQLKFEQEARKQAWVEQAITLEEYLNNRNGMEVTIYWVTKDPDKISRIQARFGLGTYVSVNGETPANIKDEDIELLRETEKRGFIQLRFKPR